MNRESQKYSAQSRYVIRVESPEQEIMSITKSGGLMRFDLNDTGIQTYARRAQAEKAKFQYVKLLGKWRDYMIDVVDIKAEFPDHWEE